MELTILQTITRQFTEEMLKAQAGEQTSLPFIRHQLAQKPIVADGETFQVLTVGGSIFKNALVKRIGDTVEVLSLHEIKQPIFKTKDDFLSFAGANTHPQATVVSINFAYPLRPIFEEDRLDGVLISGTKEHEFSGLAGLTVGKTFERYLASTIGSKVKVAVANDTICLLLSGLLLYPQDQLAAGIVGSGVNFALFLADGTAVNLESANFNKFPLSEGAKVVDENSQKKGSALFEKETAGAYLHQVFSAEAKRRGLSAPQISTTAELDAIAQGEDGPVKQLAREVLHNSAELVACQIAGIVEFYKKDTIFNMEGSLFWKGFEYKATVEKTVNQLVSGHTVSYAEIPHSGILGAAKLVT